MEESAGILRGGCSGGVVVLGCALLLLFHAVVRRSPAGGEFTLFITMLLEVARPQGQPSQWQDSACFFLELALSPCSFAVRCSFPLSSLALLKHSSELLQPNNKAKGKDRC